MVEANTVRPSKGLAQAHPVLMTVAVHLKNPKLAL